jgi:hypothetical protein
MDFDPRDNSRDEERLSTRESKAGSYDDVDRDDDLRLLDTRWARIGIVRKKTKRGRTCNGCRSSRQVSVLRPLAEQVTSCRRTCRRRPRRSGAVQVTSKPYGDSSAVKLDQVDFASGSLEVTSYVRPGKLFTANTELITSEVGSLRAEALTRVVDAVVALLRSAAASSAEP